MKYAIQEPIPMNAEQKFFFDLRGWILLPGVLSDEEIGAMKAEAYSVDKAEQQQSINPRQSYRGTLQTLLDHPAIVGILSEILAEEPFLSDDFYAFRCENSFITDSPARLEQAGTRRWRNATCRAAAATGQRHAVSSGWREDLRRP